MVLFPLLLCLNTCPSSAGSSLIVFAPRSAVLLHKICHSTCWKIREINKGAICEIFILLNHKMVLMYVLT